MEKYILSEKRSGRIVHDFTVNQFLELEKKCLELIEKGTDRHYEVTYKVGDIELDVADIKDWFNG